MRKSAIIKKGSMLVIGLIVVNLVMVNLAAIASVSPFMAVKVEAGAVQAASEAEEEDPMLPQYYQQLEDYVSLKDAELAAAEEEIAIEIIVYEIQPGDTVYEIAREHDTDVETLAILNDLSNPALIHPGEELEVLNDTGLVHTVESGETLEKIASEYYKDEEDLIRVSAEKSGELRKGERVVVPSDDVTTLSRGMYGSGNFSESGDPSFEWPVDGRISSPFGWRGNRFHYGLDIAAPLGEPVRAAADGEVIFNTYRGNYGLLVEIEHDRHWVTRYAHNSKVLVEPGQKVYQGEVISEVGSTGYSTGPHVHFEIIYRDERLDPMEYLP